MTLPQHVDTFQKMGVKLDRRSARRSAERAARRDRVARRLHGIVRVARGPHRHEPSLRAGRAAVQLDAGATTSSRTASSRRRAPTRSLAGPSQRVMVVQAYKDITNGDARRPRQDQGSDRAQGRDRRSATRRRSPRARRIARGCAATVSAFFGGGQYQLIEMLEIKDVRLVYVPHRAVGNYGGEIDNWAWPRHTGDLSFYRAYVGKDGKPAEYSPDNVPFKPPHCLKVATRRPQAGRLRDGHRLSRRRRAAPTRRRRSTTTSSGTYRTRIEYLQQKYDDRRVAPRRQERRPRSRRRPPSSASQNGLEKYEGMLDGLDEGRPRSRRRTSSTRRSKAWAAQPGHEPHKAAHREARADPRRRVPHRARRLRTRRRRSAATQAAVDARCRSRAGRRSARRRTRSASPASRSATCRARSPARSVRADAFDRTLDRERFRLALVRALQLPEADRPWLATLLDAQEGPEDRRGVHR